MPAALNWQSADLNQELDQPGWGAGAIHLWLYPTQPLPQGGSLPDWARGLPVTARERLRTAGSALQKENVLTWLGAELLISRYAGISVGELRLAPRGDGRKPRLDPEAHPGSSLKFNLSHSGGWTLLALAREREVGVDLEREREFREPLRFAKRFLHPLEAEHLQLIRRAERSEALRRLWVRKEAAAKATGYGLPLGLASFSALGGPDWTELTLRKARADADCPWSLLTLPDLEDWPLASALCVEGPATAPPELRLFRL